jgi:hypothetical protein
MPYQIIYSSVSSTPMQQDDLEDILENAQSNNAAEGITGALVYVDGHFMQILEGERSAVGPLMGRIAKDLRHESVVLLLEGDVEVASFPDWTMAYVSATPEQVAQWAGLGAASSPPHVWASMRHNPEKAAQVARSILSVLNGSAPS